LVRGGGGNSGRVKFCCFGNQKQGGGKVLGRNLRGKKKEKLEDAGENQQFDRETKVDQRERKKRTAVKKSEFVNTRGGRGGSAGVVVGTLYTKKKKDANNAGETADQPRMVSTFVNCA